jgi:trk system potassium uptake protein TrkA
MNKERLIAVFGLGSFGTEICRYLSSRGANVIAIDRDPGLIERVKDEVGQAMLIDSTDEESLADGQLDEVESAVVAMGENIESSILTTALLKKIGVPKIVARAVNELHARVLNQIGADQIVNLEIDQGRRVASQLLAQDLLDAIPVSDDYSIAEVYVPERYVGKGFDPIRRLGVNVMAVRRSRTDIDDMGNPVRSETVFLARDEEVLQENDVLIVVGRNEGIAQLRD